MNAMSRNTLLLSLLILSAVHADTLNVKNETPRNVCVGIYHQELPMPGKKPGLAQLATQRTLIESDTEKTIQQAARRTRFDRIMTCAENKEFLKPELSNEDLLGEKYNGRNVGDLQGDTFYIGDNDAKFYIYSPTEWKVNQPINQKECSKNTKNLPAIIQNPHKDKVAHVRIGNELGQDEQAFLSKRLPIAQKSLEAALHAPVKKPLKIAVVCNGTGIRSTLYCLGALQGLQDLGILDAVTYIASAAGATWGISSWYSSGMELSAFNDWISHQLKNGIASVNPNEATAIGQSLMAKFVSNQPLGAVDMYGALLSNTLCGWNKNDHQHVYLSGQADRIKNGQLPMPLYTAVRAEHTSIKHQAYEWNPYEAGSLWLGMYTPIWGFGRKFDKGSSTNKAPELTLGNLMGIWGFQRTGVISQQLEKAALNKKMTTECTQNLVTNLYECLDSYRSFEAQIPNFTRGMPKSPIPYSISLSLTDANESMSSSAYPVVSGERNRAIDVLIFIDASHKLQALDMAHAYAQARNLPFIPQTFEKAKDSVVTVYTSNPKGPIIIYQPLIVDEKALRMVSLTQPELKTYAQDLEKLNIYKCIGQGVCASDNFVYSPVQAQQLINLGQINILSAKDSIVAALRQAANKKN